MFQKCTSKEVKLDRRSCCRTSDVENVEAEHTVKDHTNSFSSICYEYICSLFPSMLSDFLFYFLCSSFKALVVHSFHYSMKIKSEPIIYSKWLYLQ